MTFAGSLVSHKDVVTPHVSSRNLAARASVWKPHWPLRRAHNLVLASKRSFPLMPFGAGYQLRAPLLIEVQLAGTFLATRAHARGARAASRLLRSRKHLQNSRRRLRLPRGIF